MSQPCVIARLAGGLGNQLFMYAFNKAMAERNKVPLKLDVRGGFMKDPTYQRTHLLDQILEPALPASPWESRLFPLGKTVPTDWTASSMRCCPSSGVTTFRNEA